jgi:hypothetical protein
MCEQHPTTFAQGLRDLGYKSPEVVSRIRVEVSRFRLPFKICILQFAICNVPSFKSAVSCVMHRPSKPV